MSVGRDIQYVNRKDQGSRTRDYCRSRKRLPKTLRQSRNCKKKYVFEERKVMAKTRTRIKELQRVMDPKTRMVIIAVVRVVKHIRVSVAS